MEIMAEDDCFNYLTEFGKRIVGVMLNIAPSKLRRMASVSAVSLGGQILFPRPKMLGTR